MAIMGSPNGYTGLRYIGPSQWLYWALPIAIMGRRVTMTIMGHNGNNEDLINAIVSH